MNREKFIAEYGTYWKTTLDILMRIERVEKFVAENWPMAYRSIQKNGFGGTDETLLMMVFQSIVEVEEM